MIPMGKGVVKELCCIIQAGDMKGNGITIEEMEGDSKGILIKTPIQESLRMAKLMVMAFIIGGKKKNTMGSGKRV